MSLVISCTLNTNPTCFFSLLEVELLSASESLLTVLKHKNNKINQLLHTENGETQSYILLQLLLMEKHRVIGRWPQEEVSRVWALLTTWRL